MSAICQNYKKNIRCVNKAEVMLMCNQRDTLNGRMCNTCADDIINEYEEKLNKDEDGVWEKRYLKPYEL